MTLRTAIITLIQVVIAPILLALLVAWWRGWLS